MSLRVTLGLGTSDASGPTEVEFPVPEGQSLEFGEVVSSLGVQLRDSEGALLVFVNEKICSPGEQPDLRLLDGDHLALYRMLSGG